MSKVHKKGPTSPQMNMTPMIDVVFQLIIFFMLVNNIISEEAVQMIVPELENPKTRELGPENRITVNLAPQSYDPSRPIGDLNIPGEPSLVKVGLEQYSLDDIEGVTATLKEVKAANENVEVLLRADCGLFYDEVQPVMQAITSAGIVKVNLVAYLPEDRR
jgi:biopolymer transport protein ExbD